MRPKRPSQTSSLVAMLRALAHEGLTEVRDFKDPTAFVMLPPVWQLFARLILRRMKNPRFRECVFGERSSGRSDLVPLRTRVFDDGWHSARAAGIHQLVLLGAGLDGRAFRLDDIGDSTVFEVDHPSTQQLKRERVARLTPKAGRHVYVPVDFEKDKLADGLERAGHGRGQQTFWIWEGVTPYLTRAAQRATLAAIAERSAAGSRLAMTYVEPAAAKDKGHVVRMAVVVRLFGEPFLGFMTRQEAADLIGNARFRVLEDSDARDWRRRYSTKPDRRADAYRERIVVAEKTE
jgi:methyltransferase (TIGR00027 family)